MKLRYDMIDCYVVRQRVAGGPWEILQLHRKSDVPIGDTWQAVHGKIKDGETAWRAAQRELREETGLTPREFYQLDTLNIFYSAPDDTIWHCPAFCAVVEPDAVITLNHEHDAIRWIDRSQIDTHFMWPGQRMALVELVREIFNDGPAKGFLRINLEP